MLCFKKYKEGGIENALFDAPERGRNAEITEQLSLQFDENGNLILFPRDEQMVHVLSYDEKPGIQAKQGDILPPFPAGLNLCSRPSMVHD